jgi:hypothetical protein
LNLAIEPFNEIYLLNAWGFWKAFKWVVDWVIPCGFGWGFHQIVAYIGHVVGELNYWQTIDTQECTNEKYGIHFGNSFMLDLRLPTLGN